MRTIRFLLSVSFMATPVVAPLAAGNRAALQKGITTPADVESAYGMPIGFAVERGGALTLTYPAARLPQGALAGVTTTTYAANVSNTPSRRVRLHFNQDLTFDGYTVVGASNAKAIGLAAR